LTTFRVIPAIDLKGGRCVRLRQGRADDETVYSNDPVETARRWAGEGAEVLHVVDLDGAFHGHPVHLAVVEQICRAADVTVELGGGLRTDEHVRAVLDAGVRRAIIGTRACTHPGELGRLVEKFGDGLAVGIDARDGRVQVRGWVETTEMSAVDLAGQAAAAGVRTLIYTDTMTDGMLGGPNTAAVGEICRHVECDVVASGGITSPDDIRALGALRAPNLVGAIVGKALYDGRVRLDELLRARP